MIPLINAFFVTIAFLKFEPDVKSLYLIGAARGDNGGNGERDKPEIIPETSAVDVFQIEFHPFIETDVAAAGDLPEASHARLDGETPELARGVVGDLIWQGRSGADDTHIPADDVDELRHLVNAQFAQPTSDRGDTGIAPKFEDGTGGLIECNQVHFHGVGVGNHRLEFEAEKSLAVLAGAELTVEDAAFTGQSHQERGCEPDGGEDDEQ